MTTETPDSLEPTREDIVRDLVRLQVEAEHMSRRGIAFIRTNAEYRQIHARIDELLIELVGR